MDKQMIEEMREDIELAIANGKKDSWYIEADLPDWIAESLDHKGYRKIPENAVVMTREKTVDLFDSKASGFMTSAIGDIPLNIDGMRKLVDEVSRLLIVQADLQELNAKYYNEAKDLRRELKQARKETAEKFAERLKEKLNEWLEDNEDLDGKIDFGIAQIELIGVKSLDGEIIAESLIEEICKEITDKEVQNGN